LKTPGVAHRPKMLNHKSGTTDCNIVGRWLDARQYQTLFMMGWIHFGQLLQHKASFCLKTHIRLIGK
jgi:hypothetical protein